MRASSAFEVDSLCRPLRFRRLRKCHRQHSLLEARLDFISIDNLGNLEAALEGAEEALAEIVVFFLLLLFFLPFTLDR
jgi:hypothetical protein